MGTRPGSESRFSALSYGRWRVRLALFVGATIGAASCGSQPVYMRGDLDGSASVDHGEDRAQPGSGGAGGGAGAKGGGAGSSAVGGGGGTGAGGAAGASQTGGGAGTGGAGAGGAATGGAATGGSGTGGSTTGGAGTGGTSTGGAATGGAATGGAATGGAATGGAATGGAATGGAATGGTSTGGAATGGTGAGGGGASGGAGVIGNAGILSIDFVGGQMATTLTPMADKEVAGVKPADHWNAAVDFMGTKSDLVVSGGAVSAASVMWNANNTDARTSGIWQVSIPDAPGDARMLAGYLDPTARGTPGKITVSGLPPVTAAGYDVYVYFCSDPAAGETRTSQYSIGSTVTTVTQTGPAPSSLPKYALANNGGTGNYLVFHGVTGTSFTLTATPSTSTLLRERAPVNGLQIVWPAGS